MQYKLLNMYVKYNYSHSVSPWLNNQNNTDVSFDQLLHNKIINNTVK